MGRKRRKRRFAPRIERSAAEALAEKLGKSVKDLRRTKKKGNSKRKVKSESAQEHFAVMFGLYVRAAAELDVPIAALYPKDVVNTTQSAHSTSWRKLPVPIQVASVQVKYTPFRQHFITGPPGKLGKRFGEEASFHSAERCYV